MTEELHQAASNDTTVANMLKYGRHPDDIILQLTKEKERYVQRIIELEGIAPRKIKLPDGRTVIWRCPDDLVPES